MANYNDYLQYLKHIDNTTEQEIKTKIDGLNDEISNLKTSLSNLNKVKDDLTTDLANAKKQINEKVDLINLKETELKKVSNDLANVQKELKDTNFKLIELEKNYNIEHKKNTTISNELADIKSKYYILESEVKNKNNSVNDYISEIQKLHLDLENAKNDFKNASASNTSTTEQINNYRSEISNLNKIVEELKNNDNSNKVLELIKELNLEKSKVKEIENSLKTANNSNLSLKSKNQELENSVLNYKNNIKEYESTISNLKKDLENKKSGFIPYLIGACVGLFIMWIFALNYNFHKSEAVEDAVEYTDDSTAVEIDSTSAVAVMTTPADYISYLNPTNSYILENNEIYLYKDSNEFNSCDLSSLIENDKNLIELLDNKTESFYVKFYVYSDACSTYEYTNILNRNDIEVVMFPNNEEDNEKIYISFIKISK